MQVVVVDEAAMVPDLEQAWHSIRPMLTDLQGEAWFLSRASGWTDRRGQSFQDRIQRAVRARSTRRRDFEPVQHRRFAQCRAQNSFKLFILAS